MNKIFNWTFGACFRTLGRFLAIFIVGVLLIFIGSKIGIELPDWLSLKIKAASNYGFSPGWSQNLPNLGRVDYKECTSSTNCTTLKPVSSFPGYNGNIERDYIVNDTWSMQIGTNGYVLNSPVGSLKKDYLYNIEFYICGNKQLGQEVEIYATDYNDAYNNSNIYNEITRTNLSPEAFLDTELNMNSCYLYSGLVVPEKDYSWAGLRIRSTSSVITNVIIPTIAVNVRELGIYSNSLENIIQNSGFATSESVEQVQESVSKVQEEIQQTQDTITNEDTTGAEDSASGFFNDFTTETFGLTSIITAPLNSINSLISSSCSPLVLPLPYVDKNLSLPCMSIIYNQYFGAFFSIYQLITTGLISYYVIVRIFNLVKDFKNPDHDEIEVVDL